MRKLRARGLEGVQLVISDQHAGLVAAIKRCFQGAAHQRCRVHFARNLMAMIPKGHQAMVSAAFKTVFAQVTGADMHAQSVAPQRVISGDPTKSQNVSTMQVRRGLIFGL